MKKLTLSLLAAALISAAGSASAWWGNGWGGGWNPYDPWDPRFWMEEFFGGGYYGGYGGPWGYGGGPWGYGGPWGGAPWGWGGYGYPYSSGYYAAGPWSGYGYPHYGAPRLAAVPSKTESSE